MVIAQTVESIFYMWRTTGDVKWRERGYGIFQAIEKYAKTTYGYSSLHGVDQQQVRLLNDMPRYVLLSSVEHKSVTLIGFCTVSWFLAETLKYLYLLFDDTNAITFNNWVFNTEAHPLPVFSWTDEERRKFKVSP